MAIEIKITLNERLYLKDPQETSLGQNIIKHSVLLIDEVGFEAFNFKSLAERMHSTEASVYRYFENKHMLLIYLVSWYWEWTSYLIDINMMNINDPKQKLKIIIKTFVDAAKDSPCIEYIDKNALHRLIISEGTKAYHTKAVDKENKDGFFTNYKELCEKISKVIHEFNSDFPYPHALASNLFEMANNHIYFAEHLPALTDVEIRDNNFDEIKEMLEYFAFSALT